MPEAEHLAGTEPGTGLDHNQPVAVTAFMILHILSEDDWDKKTEESDYVADWLRDNSYQLYKNLGFDEYETFEEFKTIKGTEVVAFGYYGHD